MDTFRTLIIPADDAPLARFIAAAFGPGGVGMWTTDLSADGEEPTTHYISAGFIPDEFVSLAPCATWKQDELGDWVQTDRYPGDAATVYAYALQAGLAVTLAQIETVFANADVSIQEPFVALDRMGLRLINTSEND